MTPASFLVSVIEQVTEKDVQTSGTYNNLDTISRLKFLAGDVIGRFTGYYPFPNVTGSHPFSLNPTGWINKWTGLGIGAELLTSGAKKVGIKLPYSDAIKKAGSGFLLGGIIGGIFDPPARSEGGTRQMSSSILSSNSASRVQGFGGTYS